MQSLKPRLLQSVQPTLVGSTENSSFPSQPRSMARKLAAMGSLKFLVYAIRKALETMPQPWEAVRYVTVAHQKAGALTYILSKVLQANTTSLGNGHVFVTLSQKMLPLRLILYLMVQPHICATGTIWPLHDPCHSSRQMPSSDFID